MRCAFWFLGVEKVFDGFAQVCFMGNISFSRSVLCIQEKGGPSFFSSRSSLQSILDSCVNLGDDSIDRYHKSNVYYIFFKQQMLAF